MKTNCFFIIFAAVILGSCGQGTPSTNMGASADTSKIGNVTSYDTTRKNADTTGTSKSGDADFLKTAYTVGMFEIQAAQLADKTSKNAQVKKFAAMVIEDHTAMNKAISALAQKESVTLPNELSGDTKAEYNKLQGLAGAAFDKEYIDANVNGHKDAIKTFEQVANGNEPIDTKTLATNDLPKLKKHLEHAEMVQKQLMNSAASSSM